MRVGDTRQVLSVPLPFPLNLRMVDAERGEIGEVSELGDEIWFCLPDVFVKPEEPVIVVGGMSVGVGDYKNSHDKPLKKDQISSWAFISLDVPNGASFFGQA